MQKKFPTTHIDATIFMGELVQLFQFFQPQRIKEFSFVEDETLQAGKTYQSVTYSFQPKPFKKILHKLFGKQFMGKPFLIKESMRRQIKAITLFPQNQF